MKLELTGNAPDLRQRAAALTGETLDAALRAAAQEVRAEIAADDPFDDNALDDDVIRIEPLKGHPGYAVVMDGTDGWLMEAGAPDAPARTLMPRLRRLAAALGWTGR